MSLLFFDGFDGYDAAGDMSAYGGWTVPDPAGVSVSSAVRVGTGMCYNTVTTNSSAANYVVLPASQAGKTIFIGFSLKLPSITAGYIFSLTAALGASAQTSLYVNSNNRLEARNGATVLATGATVLAAGTWHYIEAKILVANSGGIFDVRINGVSEFTSTGDTQAQATNEVLAYGSITTPILVTSYDDFYILNSDGSANNTYLGEQRIQIITPTSDSTVAFSRNTGASNFSAVDDTVGAPDADTTYVYATTTGTKDEYGLSDLTGVNVVAGVKVITRAEKDDANAKSFKYGIKSGATDQQATVSLGVGYGTYRTIYETSDGAGTAFTATTINSLLSTIEVV